MRQGGGLSPLLFAVYIDELLIRFERLRTGCYSGCFLWVLCVMPMILSYWHPLLLHFVFCFPSVNAFPGTRNLISTHLRHNLAICFRLKKNLMVCSVFLVTSSPSVIVYTILVMSCLSTLMILKTSIVYLWI